MKTSKQLLERRKARVRWNLRKRNTGKLRLSVHRSNKNIYAQIIDDVEGKTLVAASTLDKELRENIKGGANVESAQAVGKLIAKRALDAGLKEAVFDRGGYLYHGRVKSIADGAREAGLKV